MLSVLIDVLLPIAVVAAAGFLLRKTFPLDQVSLNRVMIYGLSPALIFVSLVRTELNGADASRMLILSVGVVAAMAVVTFLCAWPLGLRGGDMSAMMLVTLFMNTGNYGLPAARFAFGEEGFTQALFYFVAQSIMGQTLSVAVAAMGDAAPGWGMLRDVVKRVVRMPHIYAVLAALLLRFLGFDPDTATGVGASLFEGAALLSEAALPLMLVILGMQLGSGVKIEQPGWVALGTCLRLLVSPLVAYGLALLLGLNGVSLAVGVMMAGMPTAVNMTIIAIEFNSRPSLVVGSVVASSLGSLATLSVILSLMHL